MPVHVIPLGNGPTGFQINPADAAPVGELIIKCSWLDRFTLTALGLYLGIEMAAAERVFATDSGASLRERLRNVIDELETDAELKADWDRWCDDVEALNRDRSEIVHALWAFGPDGMEGTRLRRKGSYALTFDRNKTLGLVDACGVLSARWMSLSNRKTNKASEESVSD